MSKIWDYILSPFHSQHVSRCFQSLCIFQGQQLYKSKNESANIKFWWPGTSVIKVLNLYIDSMWIAFSIVLRLLKQYGTVLTFEIKRKIVSLKILNSGTLSKTFPHVLTLLRNWNPCTVTLANSVDPDEMLQNAAFHQGLLCLLRQNPSSEKEIQYLLLKL